MGEATEIITKQLAEKDEEHKETEVFYPHESDEDSDKKDE